MKTDDTALMESLLLITSAGVSFAAQPDYKLLPSAESKNIIYTVFYFLKSIIRLFNDARKIKHYNNHTSR